MTVIRVRHLFVIHLLYTKQNSFAEKHFQIIYFSVSLNRSTEPFNLLLYIVQVYIPICFWVQPINRQPINMIRMRNCIKGCSQRLLMTSSI